MSKEAERPQGNPGTLTPVMDDTQADLGKEMDISPWGTTTDNPNPDQNQASLTAGKRLEVPVQGCPTLAILSPEGDKDDSEFIWEI